MTWRPIRKALLSVHDKSGVVELATALAGHGVELLSTGGTAKALRDAGLPVREVSEVTGFPEVLDGRVKTLHPAIHGGLLARRDLPGHMATLLAHGIGAIDLLVSNLYPFERTVAAGAGFDDCVEQIDVGGPAMLRAASKNHDGVAVLVDPADYAELLAALAATGGTGIELRRRLAAKAFAQTAAYDAAIARWMAGDGFPDRLTLAGRLGQTMRYGENPHQRAALYVGGEARPGVATATQLQGKELSWNNLNDTDAAYELVAELAEPAVVIVKHAVPCGVAVAGSLVEAWRKALACDPLSAFGGIVACNRPLDGATAAEIAKIFTEVVIAPDADAAARAALAAKTNLRLLVTGSLPDPAAPGLVVRTLAGGLLVQSRDSLVASAEELRCVTRRQPTDAERRDLLFAWTVVKHVRSNAIVLARDGMATGIGGGQTSRVDAVELASIKAERAGLKGVCVVASDAFFPFADGLQMAIAAGATAAIQPGGSVRDKDVIAAADAADLAMLFTGTRHFRH
ncbi:MAG TPA: bifunctional phosphoribosylaminoimidazolecarboxamide formyltransferase/IMP cyclohydrolase [Geminicoccaceae bacterium]|nr:bifunctional phosphoribosylaminoimidazolecarboxamide formyltransferase/IMP cyclohydrolase [Geminicoccus sp.]HMU51270.1 bifunctional phosphoribosylaminoimidazolecarboxamide formyltransferase/IMP cyclohydrolase [Geminicoccaceae bacterium]